MKKGINKTILEYIKTNHTPSYESFCLELGEYSGNVLSNALFLFMNDYLSEFNGNDDLMPIEKATNLLQSVLLNNPEVNRKSIIRKISKLYQKIDTIKHENKNKFTDRTKAYKELGSLEKHLENLEKIVIEKDSGQYELIRFLINDTKNLTYLEQTFDRLNQTVNVQSKNGTSLFNNVVSKYLENIEDPTKNREDLLYYNNVITLIQNQKSFQLKDDDRKSCLQKIYIYIERLSSKDKAYKDKIYWLNNLKVSILEENKKVDIETLASKYNIHVSFEERLLDEVKMYQTPISKELYPDRIVIDDHIITIDGEEAIEIDDGLSCKKLKNGNILLGVHIASVLGYIPYSSPLIDEAFERKSSIYLPRKYQTANNEFKKIIPQFPYEFSAVAASLLEGKERLARSYYYELDSEGNLVNEKFLKTIIKNSKKATYNEINNIIEHGTTDERLQETVSALVLFSDTMENKLTPQELYLKVKEEKYNIDDTRVGNTKAEKIINKAMLLNGSKVADYFAHSDRGYPCLYRVHSINESVNQELKKMIDNLSINYVGDDKLDKLYQILKGIYPKARYGTSGEHTGLNLKHYCHSTSGLRRAGDIEVEHCLEICYDKNPTDKELYRLEDEVEKRALQLNAKSNPMDWFVEDYRRSMKKVKRR